MTDNIQAIKDRLDLVDYLRQHLELRPAGKNLKALCPFHKEKTPSFMVSPERQRWHCFGGCNEGGDIFKFVMKYENVEFYDALKILAEKAGIVLQRTNPSNRRQEQLLLEINDAAKEFFRSQPLPKEYLAGRGLKEAVIEEFELGAAPAAADGIFRHLTTKGFRPAEIEQAGLIIKTERGTYWDRFRDRLMFPLHNAFGKTIGFTGRILKEKADLAKYVNSPETPIFSKSKFLYGWHKSKETVRQNRAVALVEGQMDFLMGWQDGVKNIVATSGTALTGEHLKTIKRSSDKLILAFDTDLAGRAATERSVDLAEAADFEVRVAALPAKDPADIVKNQPGMLAQLIKEARPAMQYYFDYYLAPWPNKDIYEKKNSIRLVLGKIKNIKSAVLRVDWLKSLADLTDIDEKILGEELDNLEIKEAQPAGPKELGAAASQKPSRHELVAQEFLGAIMQEKNSPTVDYRVYLPPLYQPIFDYLTLPQANLSLPPALAELLNLIDLQPISPAPLPILFRELQREHYRNECQQLRSALKEAERRGDRQELERLLKTFDQVSKKLHNVSA